MFMVLVLHADYAAFGWPKYFHVTAAPEVLSGRILLEQFAIPAVDVFILISGWFGIRPTVRGMLKLLFQVAFVSLCAVGASCLYNGNLTVSLADVLRGLLDYWFVWSYLLLFVMSPILNGFLRTATRREVERWMLVFFTFAAVNLVFKFTKEFNLGYSSLFFMGLYVMGHYLRHYVAESLKWKSRTLWLVFGSATVLPALLHVASAYVWPVPFFGALTELNTAYCNPVVVIQAASLLLLFSRMMFQSRFVNWVAASAFSVYVFHQNGTLLPIYFKHVRAVGTYPYLEAVVLGFVFLCFVFALSVLVDRLRILAWNGLTQIPVRRALPLLLAAFLLLGCEQVRGIFSPKDGAKEATEDSLERADVRLALLPTADCLPFYYAQESGIYERLGLRVAFETYQSQNDCDSAILGHADGGYVDTLRLAALSQRASLQTIGRTRTACGVVSAASVRLRAAKDLEGRVVAMAPRTLSEQTAYAAVRSGGIATTAAMYPHVTSFRVASDMVRESQVDAAALPEPYLARSKWQGAKELYNAATGWGGAVVVKSNGEKTVPASRAELLRRGYNAAVDSLNRNKSLAAPLLCRYSGIEPALADSLRLPKYQYITR